MSIAATDSTTESAVTTPVVGEVLRRYDRLEPVFGSFKLYSRNGEGLCAAYQRRRIGVTERSRSSHRLR